MIILLKNRITLVWLLLVIATCVSWLLFVTGNEVIKPLPYFSTAIIVLSFIKVSLIIHYFMEVRIAGFALKLVANIWIAGICALLLLVYWEIH